MHAGNVAMFHRYRWLGLLALGFVFLLFVPWLQKDFWSTQCPGQTWCDRWWRPRREFAFETFLCVGVILLGAAGGCVGTDRITERIVSFIKRRTIWLTAFTIVAAVLLPLSVAWFVLDRFPNSGDEFSYVFQARTFAGFRLWETPPVLGTDLIPFRTWIFESKWVGQYPPGWPMVLSVGLLLGLPPWMVNPIVGGGSVAALIALCRRVGDQSSTVVAAAFYTLMPFYVMNAASYFPHVFSSLLILIICLCLLLDGEISRGRNLIAAGAAIGLLAMTRYFDVLLLLPALLFWLVRQRPAAWLRIIGLMALGFVPFLGLLMIYQDLITGSPFRTTYFVINSPEITYPSLEPSLIKIGAKYAEISMEEFALWTSPILLITYSVCMLLKLKDRKLAYYDLIFPSFVLGYVALANLGGNRYGPRYYFDAFPLLMVTIVSALPSVTARLKRPIGRAMQLLAPIACLLYLLSTWPLVLTNFRREVFSRQEPFRLAAQAMLANAVVIPENESYGLSQWDLVRNPASMDAAVLYARGGVDIEALRKAFPERSIWRYIRPDPTQPGQLVRVTP